MRRGELPRVDGARRRGNAVDGFVVCLPAQPADLDVGHLPHAGGGIGPLGLGLLRIDLRDQLPWFERVTEMGVIVVLFVGGLKMRLPLRHRAWTAALLARWRVPRPRTRSAG